MYVLQCSLWLQRIVLVQLCIVTCWSATNCRLALRDVPRRGAGCRMPPPRQATPTSHQLPLTARPPLQLPVRYVDELTISWTIRSIAALRLLTWILVGQFTRVRVRVKVSVSGRSSPLATGEINRKLIRRIYGQLAYHNLSQLPIDES